MDGSGRLPKHFTATTIRSAHTLLKQMEMIQLKRQLEVLATFVPNEVLNFRGDPRRNFVTVLLFADVSGFTSLTEKYNKTGKGGIYRLTATLNAYIGAILEVIHLFGGDILKFSGDAFLASWKVKHGQPVYDVIHIVIVCALVIQKNLGVFETEVNVLLKVKLAIACGNVTFAVIGSGVTKNYVIIGQSIYDVKNAEHVSVSGDIVISPSAWSHMMQDHYVVTETENGNVKVWNTIYRKSEEHKRIYFDELIAEGLIQIEKHLNHRKRIHVKKSFESNSMNNRIIEMFLRSLPKREEIKKVPKYWSVDELRPFIIKPVHAQVDEGQPVEYLTEMRDVTIQFINIVPMSREVDNLLEMCDCSYKIICKIVGESLGVVNKLSLFDKDFMILVLFGLRGIRHEMESQHALRTGFNIRRVITQNVINVASCSIGITQGLVYCGVVGHPFRREYTVIGTEVNKAARMMCAYNNRVTCDHKTFKHSQLASFYFQQLAALKLKGIEDSGSIFEYNEEFDDFEGKRMQKLTIYGRSKEYNMIRSVIFKSRDSDEDLHQYNGICFNGPQKIGKTSILLQSVRALRKIPDSPMIISMELSNYSFVPFSTLSKLYDKIFNRLGLLHNNLSLMPHLPRQLFKPDLDMWFPRDDLQDFKYNILNNFRRIVEVNKANGTIIFIDNIEYLDSQSWDILQIVFNAGLINVFYTSCIEEAEWKLQDALKEMPGLYIQEVSPISSRYIAALACMFLDAVGIPQHLEYLLMRSCDGRPGYVQSSILRLINNGTLQLKLINKLEKNYDRFIFPIEINFEERGDIVAIVEFSDRYRYIGQELTLQAISMDLFDSFTPYQQLVIKTASVIGDLFCRSLLQVAMQFPAEEQLAKVVMQLFDEEVFECGAKYINASDMEATASSKFCCRCYYKEPFDPAEKQFPQYAFCKIIHFKNKSIREVAYDLLPGNQKKELHLLCTEVLEATKHACPLCVNQPILYILNTCTYKTMMDYCLDPKKVYRTWSSPEGDYGDMKKVIRDRIFGTPAETLPNDIFERPTWDARQCSCFEIWITVFQKLKFHAEQGKHTGKLVYFTMKYAFILLSVRDYIKAISYFRETVELCLVDADESNQDPVLSRFKTLVMGRAQIGLSQAHLALGQIHIAKNHLIIALRQYNIPSLMFEYRAFNELLKKTFVVNIRRLYERSYANRILRFDCGNALAHCAKLFTLEGKWSLAKAAAMNSLYCLQAINPNVSLLHHVYCNVIEVCSYIDKRGKLEKLQKYVFQEVTHIYNSIDINNMPATICLMETLLESHYVCGHILKGLRMGYRLLDICARLDYFMFDSQLFFHLPLLLIFNGRIRDAGDILNICKHRLRDAVQSMPIYYIVAFIMYLITGFCIEDINSIIDFAAHWKRMNGMSKCRRLLEVLFTLVQLHYFRLGQFHKSEQWKGDSVWNSKELTSSIVVAELIFTIQCKIHQYVNSYHMKNFTGDVEAKRINRLVVIFGDSCKRYSIYLPMYYYLKAWLLRVIGHKNKAYKFLKKMGVEAEAQDNHLMQCQAVAASNAWNGGYSIPYSRRPYVSFYEADSYTLDQLVQFLHVDKID